MHEEAENDERSNPAGDATWSDEVRAAWRELACILESIWSAYQQNGPGTLEPAWGHRLDAVNQRINSLSPSDANSQGDSSARNRLRERLSNLAQRCVRDSEGLSFITGEAGLIPRKDLHDEFRVGLLELAKFTSHHGAE